MGKRLVFWKIGWVLLAAGFLFVNGCGGGGSSGGAGGLSGGTAPILLSVTKIVGLERDPSDPCTKTIAVDNVMRSDVLTCGGYFEDMVQVTIKNSPKDPTLTAVSPYTDFQIRSYTVEFERLDAGTNVTGPVTGTISQYIPSGQEVTFNVVLVPVELKLRKPLSHLALISPTGGVEPETGLREMRTRARITFYGATVANQDHNTVGFLFVNFADWAG